MERKTSSLSRTTIAIIVIVLFHAVGLAGFLIPAVQPLFLQIVPFHLLLMLGVMGYSYGRPDVKLIAFALLVYIVGYTAEWIGVHKGWLFGDYAYGETLGFKLSGIPLTMGINWLLLIYGAGVTMQYTGIRWVPLRILIGALLLVGLDVLIEPVARRFDYWQWHTPDVPLGNYAGWFIVSIISLFFFELFSFKKLSLAGPVLLLVQTVFFALLLLA
jgi:putative membrane protein